MRLWEQEHTPVPQHHRWLGCLIEPGMKNTTQVFSIPVNRQGGCPSVVQTPLSCWLELCPLAHQTDLPPHVGVRPRMGKRGKRAPPAREAAQAFWACAARKLQGNGLRRPKEESVGFGSE